MDCPRCQSSATTERPERTRLGYRRFRCRTCQQGFNERTGTLYNRLHYPTDVVCEESSSWWSVICGLSCAGPYSSEAVLFRKRRIMTVLYASRPAWRPFPDICSEISSLL
jgi:hypothetical protein